MGSTIGNLETISDALRLVREWANDEQEELWFRGHSDETFKLIPSVLRQGPGEGASSIDEAGLLRGFVREFPEMRRDHHAELEWLMLMQHYRVPTRLLDWTTNFLVAVYFCASEQEAKDGIVYVLKAKELLLYERYEQIVTTQINASTWVDLAKRVVAAEEDLMGLGKCYLLPPILSSRSPPYDVSTGHLRLAPFESLRWVYPPPNPVGLLPPEGGGMEKIGDLSCVVAVRPPKLNSRLIAQHGAFTLHGGKFLDGTKVIDFRPLEQCAPSNVLAAIRVPANSKKRLQQEVRASGVYEATLFPEMEYRGKEIRRQNTKP